LQISYNVGLSVICGKNYESWLTVDKVTLGPACI